MKAMEFTLHLFRALYSQDMALLTDGKLHSIHKFDSSEKMRQSFLGYFRGDDGKRSQMKYGCRHGDTVIVKGSCGPHVLTAS
jgi:hypothetical protein